MESEKSAGTSVPPKKVYHKGINETLKDKLLGMYLNAWVQDAHKNLMCEMALLTLQYDPNRVKKADEAWGHVRQLEKTVVDVLAMEEDVLYIVSTVETHSGRKKKKKTEPKPSVPEGSVEVTVDQPSRLKDYPHIHMAIAFTTKTGVIRDLSTIARILLNYAQDVDIRKKDGWTSKQKQGRKLDIANDAKILGYVLKNARHEGTMVRLQRTPTVVYNFRNNPLVTQLYSGLYEKTALILTGEINIREKIQLPTPMVQLQIIPHEPSAPLETNLSSTVTEKPIAKTKIMKMINLVKTYLEQHQMAITPEGSIYERTPGSRKSWRVWGKPEQLFKDMVTIETVELLNSTHSDFMRYTSGGYKNIFPYLEMDFMWLEFGDFYFSIPTSNIVRKTDEPFEHECFNFFPEITYDMIKPVFRSDLIKPVHWLSILENSGYIVDGEPTKEGVLVIKSLYNLLMPKTHKSKELVLFGDSNAGKSSLIAPIQGILPKDKVQKIHDDGGFELAGLVSNPRLVISEEHHSKRLARDQALILLEGKIEDAVRAKHKELQNVEIKARSVFISNDLDWAYEKPKNPLEIVAPVPSTVTVGPPALSAPSPSPATLQLQQKHLESTLAKMGELMKKAEEQLPSNPEQGMVLAKQTEETVMVTKEKDKITVLVGRRETALQMSYPIDKAYGNRLVFCRMSQMPEGKCDSEVRDEMIKMEQGKIPLYAAKVRFGEEAFKDVTSVS